MHIAAYNARVEVVELLIAQRADIYAQNNVSVSMANCVLTARLCVHVHTCGYVPVQRSSTARVFFDYIIYALSGSNEVFCHAQYGRSPLDMAGDEGLRSIMRR